MKHFDDAKFREDLSNVNWLALENMGNVDEQWNFIRNNITRIWDSHAPLRTIRCKKKPQHKPWINADIKAQMKVRNDLYKKFTKSKSDSDWKAYKVARNRVSSMVSRSKYLHFQDKISSKPQGVWQTVNDLLGRTSSSKVSPAANRLCEYFASAPHIALESIPPSTNVFQSYLGPAYRFSDQSVFCTETDVLKLVLEVGNGRSAGLDGISNFMIKKAGGSIVRPLTLLFNNCIACSAIPKDWKKAKITPVDKKKGSTELKNYRPISLLPCVSKIYEKILAQFIRTHLDSNNILCHSQHGFRSRFSTTTALVQLVNKICNNLDRSEFTPLLLLDLSKAFDTVNHDILLFKLRHYGLCPKLVEILRDYLFDRWFCVSSNGETSTLLACDVGVPQGSVLGPLLFTLYVNDFQNCLDRAEAFQYADDTAILSSSCSLEHAVDSLTDDLIQVSDWFSVNRLKLNVDKTQFIIFGSKTQVRNSRDTSIKFQNMEIKQSSNIKYLGLLLDSTLSFDSHVDHLISKVTKVMGALSCIRFLIPLKQRSQIYQALVLPHLSYCISVWTATSEHNIKRIEVLLNRVCRHVLHVKAQDMHTEQLYRNLNYLTFRNMIIYHSAMLAHKLLNGYYNNSFNIPPRLSDIHSYPTRNNNMFQANRTNNVAGRKAPILRLTNIWNDLPNELKHLPRIASFKKALRARLT